MHDANWCKRQLSNLCLAIWLAGLIGCVSQPKPPPPPLVAHGATELTIGHFAGTPLSGTILKAPDAVTPADSLAVEVVFVAVQSELAGLHPLGAQARLIIASHGANPVRSTGNLTRAAAYATGDDAQTFADQIIQGTFGRALTVGSGRGALATGTTARFEITDSGKQTAITPSGLGHRRFGVQICRPINLFNRAGQTAPAGKASEVGIEVGVVLDDVAVPEAQDSSETSGASKAPLLNLETVLMDPLVVQPQSADKHAATAVIAVPFHFRGGENKSVAAIIRLRKGSAADPIHRATCERANRDLQTSFQRAQADAESRPPASPDEATVLDLLAAMAVPETRRSSSVYLAGWSGARICEDVALSSDDAALADLAILLAEALPEVAREKPSVGWRMDRIALGFLVDRMSKGKLPPELAAILSDRAGEAGRHASAMEEILRDVRGPVDLDDRLVATNRLYLEDSAPSSRARAYDWLKNRNRHEEPEGYLPLSPARDRRQAIEKDNQQRLAASAAAATRPATQPAGVP